MSAIDVTAAVIPMRVPSTNHTLLSTRWHPQPSAAGATLDGTRFTILSRFCHGTFLDV